MGNINDAKAKYLEMVLTKKSQTEQIKYVTGWLNRTYHFKFVEGNTGKTDQLYVYDGGIYIDARRFIINVIEEITDTTKTGFVNEIINKVGRKDSMKREEFIRVEHPELVCMENGILNLETKTLKKHSPDIIFETKIPVIYNKGIGCPLFIEFIEDTLSKTDILGLQEWMGFMLWRRYFKKKAIVLMGPTDTGKTVLLNVMMNMVGAVNKTSFDFHKLTSNNFATSNLYGKSLAVNDELSSKGLDDVSTFKKLTGDSSLMSEKKFQDSFDFFNYAKITCACNKMPVPEGTLEDPRSYFNRWLILKFDFIVDVKNQDNDLVSKLCTKDGLSGLLNWSIKGLDRLRKNNVFSNDMDWSVIRSFMEEHADSVVSFIKKRVVRENGNVMSKHECYEAYVSFCNMYDLKCKTAKAFGKIFRNHCAYVVDYGTGKMQICNAKITEISTKEFLDEIEEFDRK